MPLRTGIPLSAEGFPLRKRPAGIFPEAPEGAAGIPAAAGWHLQAAGRTVIVIRIVPGNTEYSTEEVRHDDS